MISVEFAVKFATVQLLGFGAWAWLNPFSLLEVRRMPAPPPPTPPIPPIPRSRTRAAGRVVRTDACPPAPLLVRL